MPVFDVEMGGKAFEVEAPDQASAVAALTKFTAPEAETTLAGLGKSALSGAVGGIADLAGLPADLIALTGAKGSEDFQKAYGSQALRQGITDKTGMPFYEPQTFLEKTARTAGEFLPNMVGGGAGLATRAATRVALPALGAELAGAATEDNPYWKLGGALAGAAVPMAAGRAAGGAIRSAMEPLTDAGREMRANRVISQFAEGGPSVVGRTAIQGSEPTLAQATGNAGLAGLERHLRNQPGEIGALFTERDLANAAAREGAFRNVAGDSLTLQAARDVRSQAADANLAAAFGAKQDVGARGIVQVIDKTLNGPEGNREAVRSALQSIRNKVVLPNPLEDRIARASDEIKAFKGASAAKDAAYKEARAILKSAKDGDINELQLVSGLKKIADKQKVVGPIDNALGIIKEGAKKYQTDPEALYAIRKEAGDMMKFAGSTQQYASSQLIKVQEAIDRAITKGNPGYQTYMREFAAHSRPIDVQSILQKANITDSGGRITLGKIDQAIKTIENMRAKPGAQPAKSISTDEMRQLYAIRDDLRMAANSSLGKAIGSNTVQNAMSAGAVEGFLRNRAGAGSGGAIGLGLGMMAGGGMPGLGAVMGAGIGGILGKRFAAADADIMARVAHKMLDASGGVPVLPPARINPGILGDLPPVAQANIYAQLMNQRPPLIEGGR